MLGAAAEAGVTPREFWSLTPGEIRAAIAGYAQRRREDWRIASFLASASLHAFAGKGPKPHQLVPFAWPERGADDVDLGMMTAEERKEIAARMRARAAEARLRERENEQKMRRRAGRP